MASTNLNAKCCICSMDWPYILRQAKRRSIASYVVDRDRRHRRSVGSGRIAMTCLFPWAVTVCRRNGLYSHKLILEWVLFIKVCMIHAWFPRGQRGTIKLILFKRKTAHSWFTNRVFELVHDHAWITKKKLLIHWQSLIMRLEYVITHGHADTQM